jgi:predicted transcriptional regulator
MNRNGEMFEYNIIKILKKNNDGLTITDVSKKLNIHYITASKYLAVLEAKGIVECRNIGMAKVFKIKMVK